MKFKCRNLIIHTVCPHADHRLIPVNKLFRAVVFVVAYDK